MSLNFKGLCPNNIYLGNDFLFVFDLKFYWDHQN